MRKNKKERESSISVVYNYFMWIFLSNLYFIICNIPLIYAMITFNGEWSISYSIMFIISVVPLGPAIVALLSTMDKLIREKDLSVTIDFFTSYKKGFKKSIIIWTIEILIMSIIVIDIGYFTGTALWSFFIIMLIIAMFVFVNTNILMCRFNGNPRIIFSLAFIYGMKKITITVTSMVICIISMIILIKIPLLSVYFIFSIASYCIMYYSQMIFKKIECDGIKIEKIK